MKKFWEFIKSKFKWEHVLVYFLIILFCGVSFLQLMKGCEKDKQIKNLISELDEVDIGVRELRKGVYESRTAVVDEVSLKNREIVNEEVAKAIKENKLDTVYAATAKLNLKMQEVIEAKSKPVVIVNKPDIPITPEIVDNCNSCLGKTTIRVPFEGRKGAIAVSGYTETGEKIGLPGTYTLDIRVLEDITLSVILAQNKNKQWKTIISNPDGLLEAYNIKANIDIRPFKPSFKERISFPIGVAVGGQIVMLRTGIYFRLSKRVSMGLDVGAILNYRTLTSTDGFLGLGFGIFPW